MSSTTPTATLVASARLIRASWIATPILALIALILIVLKVGGVLALPWVWVLAPIWVGVAGGLALLAFVVFALLRQIRKNYRNAKILEEVEAELARTRSKAAHPAGKGQPYGGWGK